MSFEVPNEAVYYILLQRTELQRLSKVLQRLSLPSPHLMVAVEARVRRRQVKTNFVRQTQEEFTTLRPFLPDRCDAILDIGCGVAAIDLLLYRHYSELGGSEPKMFLLDRSEAVKRPVYGYEPTSSFYNSFGIAVKLLSTNGVNPSTIHAIEAGTDQVRAIAGVDLVVSLISWGFHYPLNAYLDLVRQVIRPDGRLILDIRKGSDGEKELERSFTEIEVVLEDPKRWRLAATRPSAADKG